MIRMMRLAPILALVLLAACVILPGTFDSALAVNRDGTFHFRYEGELIVLPLTALAQQKTAATLPHDQTPAADQAEVFTEQTCSDPQSGEARACTAAELAEQRKAWDTRHSAQSPSPATGDPAAAAALMGSTLGALNPSDPQASAKFAAALAHQAGWRKVVVKAPGVFAVEFETGGRLDHDFTFPTIEHLGMVNPLVAVIRRADGTVRVETPGLGGGTAGFAKLAAMGGKANAKPAAGIPEAKGRFVLTTDGAILANDTDEGPETAPAGQVLRWQVDAAHANAPTALIRLGPAPG